MPKGSRSSKVGDYRSILITPLLSEIFEKIVDEELNHFLERNNLLLFSVFVS